MNLKEYPDRDMLAIDVANQMAEALDAALTHKGVASLAVAGGTSPGPIFDDLCAAELDWGNVTVMASDERWVPADNARSNARLIKERLLVDRASEAQFLPFHIPWQEPEAAVAQIAPQIAAHLPLSVVLLGMGEDMHTASLFPGVSGLEAALAADAPALAVLRPDSQPEPRISLTARVLDAAVSKHLILFGSAKRDALEQALSLPPELAPVQAILSETTVYWAP